MSGPAAPPPRRSRIRSALVTAIKVGLAVALLVWVIRKGGLEAQDFARLSESPGSVALVLLLGFCGVSLSGVRWSILLRGEGIACPLLQVLKLTWIGHFWNMVIPGAVSGDAVKMYYIGQLAPELREEAWTTVFADRVIGMVALVSLSAFACLSGLDFVYSKPELVAVFYFMLAILGGAVLAALFIALGIGQSWAWVGRLAERLPLGQSLARAYAMLQRLGRRPGRVLVTYLISLGAHSLIVTNAFLLGRAAQEQLLSLKQYLVVVPIGMFSNAIPITPGGVGVGENVLGQLFVWSGGSLKDGALVMLLLRGMFYSLAVFGAVLYVLYRKERPDPTGAPAAAPASSPGDAPQPSAPDDSAS